MGREKIKDQLTSYDPTAGYHAQPFYSGEVLVNQLPKYHNRTGQMMLDQDPVVGFACSVRDAAMMVAEVDIVAKNPLVQAWVEKQWHTLWNVNRRHLVQAKKWGFYGVQPKYRCDDDGTLHVESLKDFSPFDVTPLEVGGDVTGFKLKGLRLDSPQAIWQTFDSQWGNPYGSPLLKKMYPPWYEKWMERGAKKLGQLRMIKDAYIGDVFWFPSHLTLTLPPVNGQPGKQVPWRDFVRQLAEQRLSGGALTIPSLYDDKGNKLVDYTPPQDISGGSQIFDWEDRLDKNILRGAGVPLETVEAQENGGFSGRSIPFMVILSACSLEFIDIVEAVTRMCLRPAAWLNFGGDPEFEIKPRSLVESFAEDASGSPMGGAAIGGQPGQKQPPAQDPPQIQRQDERVATQFDLGFHSFSSTQFNLPPEHAVKISAMARRIHPDDLVGDGVETEPHITIKYGLHTNTPDDVVAAISDRPPVAVVLGKTSVFPSDEHDVVKIEVEGQGIRDLNAAVSAALECTDTYPEYKPHLTIAYVKPGMGEKYAAALNDMQGTAIAFDRFTFSAKDRTKTTIPLNGEDIQFSLDAQGNEHSEENGRFVEKGARQTAWLENRMKTGSLPLRGGAIKDRGFSRVGGKQSAEVEVNGTVHSVPWSAPFHPVNPNGTIREGLVEKLRDIGVELPVDHDAIEREMPSEESLAKVEENTTRARKLVPEVAAKILETAKPKWDMDGMSELVAADFESDEFNPAEYISNHGTITDRILSRVESKMRDDDYDSVEDDVSESAQAWAKQQWETIKEKVIARAKKREGQADEPTDSRDPFTRKAEAEAAMKGKKAHEVTWEVFADSQGKFSPEERAAIQSLHRNAVIRAARAGKKLPDEVIASHPDLKELADSVQFDLTDEIDDNEISRSGAAAAIDRVRRAVRNLARDVKKKSLTMGGIEGALRMLSDGIGLELAASMQTAGFVGSASVVAVVPPAMTPPQSIVVPPAVPPLPPIVAASAPDDEPEADFPILEDALQTLRAAPINVGRTFRETAERARAGAFAVTGDLAAEAVETLRTRLTEVLDRGGTEDDFAAAVKSLAEEGPLSEARLKQIFRTNVSTALSNGQHAAANSYLVADAFPYRRYFATTDARVRPEHIALEHLGLNSTSVYRADDPVWIEFEPPFDFGCRCHWTPYTVEMAATAGVQEAKDWLARAKEYAGPGGDFHDYLSRTAPMRPEYVQHPAFRANPEFRKNTQFSVEDDEGNLHSEANGQFVSKGGGAPASAPARRKFEATPAKPIVGNEAPRDYSKSLGPDGNLIEGSVGGLSITSSERGLIGKVSKKTIAALDDVMNDAAAIESLRLGGINHLRIEPTRGEGKPKVWSAAASSGAMIFHAKTAEALADSKIEERTKHGLRRVVHHESGHGIYGRASDSSKKAFSEAIAKHPEVLKDIARIVAIAVPDNVALFDESKRNRANTEAHAELYAMSHYDPEKYNALPQHLRDAVDGITADAKRVADRFNPPKADA